MPKLRGEATMTVHSIRNFGIGRGQIFIGGRWVDSVSRDRREIRNPKDETSVDEVASSGEENVETLAQTLTAEGGKLIGESRIDVQFCALLLSYAADSARRLQGE